MVFAAVLGAVVARQLLGRGPPVWALFVVGGLATVLSGVLPPSGAEAALASAVPVLVFLFALFLFAGALDEAGALDHLARWLIGRARRSEDLPVVVVVGFGLASAFLVNDALVVIGVPVLVAVARRTALPSRPLLLSLAFAVTLGSALTPFGNPQNLLVSVASGLASPVTAFLRYLLLPTAANLAFGAWYLRRVFRRELDPGARPPPGGIGHGPALFPSGGWPARLGRHPVLLIFPGTLLVLITLDVTSSFVRGPAVPLWMTAAVGAAILLLVTPDRGPVVRKVSWEVLLLFAGLFVVVGGAVQGGLVAAAESLVPLPGPSSLGPGLLVVASTSVVGSQLVSNVPWVALEIPVLLAAGYSASTPVAWVALAAASTLAGNVTLLGAASNLIVVELAERSGVPIGLRAFVRHGLPIAAVSIVVLVACLMVGL